MPEPLKNVSIRILGIDTPEIRGKCSTEKQMAQAAKEFLHKRLLATRTITLGWMEWDKYGGRILAEVYFDGENAGDIMLSSGYAVTYNGGKKVNRWCNLSPIKTLPQD